MTFKEFWTADMERELERLPTKAAIVTLNLCERIFLDATAAERERCESIVGEMACRFNVHDTIGKEMTAEIRELPDE